MKTKLPRPETLPSWTTKIQTGYGALFVTVSELDHVPFELFATIGKSGHSTNAKTEAIGRLISLALRYHVPIEEITAQLAGISGETPLSGPDGLVMSIPDAIAKVLDKHYHKKETTK
jgi:ribonucleoside-diphosphate reductase alpha chain